MTDFLAIIETPGALLTVEQLSRMALRYSLAAEMAGGRRVLEVACGAGVGLGLLIGVARSLAACDCSASALALAHRSVGKQVMLTAADAQQLPYAAGAFDLILSFEAIYYLPQPPAFLSECHRLLSSDGRLLLSTSNPNWPFFVAGALSVHYPSVPELAHLLQEAGFQNIALYGSLPVERALSPLGAVRARVRRLLLGVSIFRRDNALTRTLKRLGYGTLMPLPPLLPASLRVANPFHELTPLQLDRPDRRHRVLFALAEK